MHYTSYKNIFNSTVIYGLSILFGSITAGQPFETSQTRQSKLQKDSISYDPYSRDPSSIDISDDDIVAVQLESRDSLTELLTLKKDDVPNTTIVDHHGADCTNILNMVADRVANKDVKTLYLERVPPISEWFFDVNNDISKMLMENTNVISISMVRETSNKMSSGNIDTVEEKETATKLWKSSSTVLILPADNDGNLVGGTLKRQHASMEQSADTMLRVGAAHQDSGTFYINHFSGKTSPSIVTLNPYYSENYQYNHMRNSDELRKELNSFYKDMIFTADWPDGDKEKTATEVMLFNLKNLQDNPAKRRLLLSKCHPNFNGAHFPGKAALLQSWQWQVQNIEAVRDGFINGFVQTAIDRERYLADQKRQGWTIRTYKDGVSFTTPNVAGMIAGALKKYPHLTEFDVVSAALLAAEPIDKVKKRTSKHYTKIPYKDNGAGLPINNDRAGFGILTQENFVETLERFSHAVLSGKCEKATPLYISTGSVEQKKTAREFIIPVEDDVTALRTNLTLQFNQASHVPEYATLINPRGGEVTLLPSKIKESNTGYSFATTDLHFGNSTQGNWKVRFQNAVSVDSITLDIAGMQKDCLADYYLKTQLSTNTINRIAKPAL